ncbi:hypothetical protein pipiens_010967 [Culex pipiens pipiens]|uniref:Cytochrome P450 n=1 Tax=Culex pipiens pipiens TaxID=38569 RepID=A0ABD1D838_CULPP
MYHLLVQVALFLAVLFCADFWWKRVVHRQLSKLPGPVSVPLLGSGYVFLGKNCSEVFYTFQRLTARYGQGGAPIRFFLGPVPFVIISSPEHAQAILSSSTCLAKPWIYRFTPLEGIFSLPVDKWRRHRKAMQPGFNLTVLNSFIPIFKRKIDILVDKLAREVVGGRPFDVYGYVAACTLDMVYSTTLGMEMNIQQQARTEYLDVLDELFELVTKRSTNVLLHPQWAYRLTSYYRRECRARQIFCAPSAEVLQRNPILDRRSPKESSDVSKPQILIDQLYDLALKDPAFDRDAIEKELNTMIFGGNETTAITMSNALLLIAMHPEVQNKLIVEITQILGESFANITIEQLQQLTYMEAVLKEAMRLLPITTILGRKTGADLQLGEYRIPAGVNLAIDVFSIHRSKEHWGLNADLFVPERFLTGKHHPYAFLGFSAGPRNCIGIRYAWISMKMTLAHVLRRFELETPLRLQDIRIKASMTLKVIGGHMISVRARE